MIFFIFWKLNVKERNRRKKEKEKKNYIIIIGQRLVTTSLNIFLLDVNFDKFTIGLHFIFIFFMSAKFLKINSHVINQLFEF